MYFYQGKLVLQYKGYTIVLSLKRPFIKTGRYL
jgi:hypothetical protein